MAPSARRTRCARAGMLSSSWLSSPSSSSGLRSARWCRSWLRSLRISFDHLVKAIPFGFGFLIAVIEPCNPCLVGEQFLLAAHRTLAGCDGAARRTDRAALDKDI